MRDRLTRNRAPAQRLAAIGRPRALSMVSNSVAVMFGKAATMALGFVFWLAAARRFTPHDVGLAAGAVSAMMLCTQLSIVGVGSAVITDFRRYAEAPARLLNTSFTLVAAVALAVAAAFLAFASSVFTELGVVASDRAFAGLFVAASIVGTLGILLDQVSITLRRGDQVLLRGLLFGGISVGTLVAIPLLTGTSSAIAIFAPWVVAGACICLVGSVQLRAAPLRYRYRPRIQRRIAGRLFRVGVPNWALTMTERAPGLILPIVVTELLSPAENATWYTVWMMAWVVYIIPISVGLALFAEGAQRPRALAGAVVTGIRSALAIGVCAALALAAFAPFALGLLGESYAEAGTTPLRILVCAVVPLAFVQAYFASCRARERLGEAIWTGIVSGSTSVAAAAAAAGLALGLTGMAFAWLGVQVATGTWAAVRLRSLATRDRGDRRRQLEPAFPGAEQPVET